MWTGTWKNAGNLLYMFVKSCRICHPGTIESIETTSRRLQFETKTLNSKEKLILKNDLYFFSSLKINFASKWNRKHLFSARCLSSCWDPRPISIATTLPAQHCHCLPAISDCYNQRSCGRVCSSSLQAAGWLALARGRKRRPSTRDCTVSLWSGYVSATVQARSHCQAVNSLDTPVASLSWPHSTL